MNGRRLAVWVLLSVTVTTLQAQQVADTVATAAPRSAKSPTTAGILSGAGAYVGVAGLGSFYAGNSGHGVRHLAIGLLTAAVAVSGIVTCADLDCSDTEGLLMVGGAVAYAANAVWSVFVAVADAHAHNRARSIGLRVEF